MSLARLYRCDSAASLEAEFRIGAGQPTLDFRPAHLLAGRIRRGPDRAMWWYDSIGDWHLRSEGGDAERVRLETDAGWRWAARTVHHSTCAWVSASEPADGHWSFAGAEWTIFWLWIIERTGDGGIPMGNMRGPSIGNEHSGNGMANGPDLGWAVSLNGDGNPHSGFGFGIYTDVAEPNQHILNIDTANDGSSNIVGQGAVPIFLQRGGGVARMRGPEAKWRIVDEHPDPGGSSASVNSTMCVGRAWYGSGAYDPSSPFYYPQNYGTVVWPIIAAFEGTAHTNLMTHADAIAAYLRAQVTA